MCRIRKRMCKHIRLVLTQLDIPDSPKEWQQVSPHERLFNPETLISVRSQAPL